MGRVNEGEDQPQIRQFRVESIIPADAVPHLTEGVPYLRGYWVLSIAGVRGRPIQNCHYPHEQIAPHLDAIREAVETQRVYWVDATPKSMEFWAAPDPHGRIDHRILAAIGEWQFGDVDLSAS